MLFSGSLVTQGKGIGLVTATGMNTRIAKIQIYLDKLDKDSMDIPVKKKMKEFGDQLAKILSIMCVLIWVVNFPNFFSPIYINTFIGALAYFKLSMTLAIVAIPENLPQIITTCLALGAHKMEK